MKTRAKTKESNDFVYDLDVEGKIKTVAEKLFIQKGFSSTLTRDIAQEADINLAMLHYYFRNKENLFNIIVSEKLSLIFEIYFDACVDDSLTKNERVEKAVTRVTELLLRDNNMVYLLCNEVQRHPDFFAEKMRYNVQAKLLFPKFMEINGLKCKEDALHHLFTQMGMIFQPFILRDASKVLFAISDEEFNSMIKKRIKMIPKWMEVVCAVDMD